MAGTLWTWGPEVKDREVGKAFQMTAWRTIPRPSGVVIVVQSLSHIWFFATPWTATCQTSLSFTIFWSLFKLVSMDSVVPSNHLFLCHLFLLHSIFPSIGVFSSELVVSIRWPKYWGFSFRISSFSEYSGLISFKDRLVWSPCSTRDFQESSPVRCFRITPSSHL